MGLLREHFPDLERWEMPERHMYCTPEFDNCISAIAPAPRVRGRNLTPHDQVEQLIYEYIVGLPMAYGVGYRKLEPLGQHIFEFRPLDVRIFGWFAEKRHFIATAAELKDKLDSKKQKKSTNALYKPFVDGAVSVRNALPLDAPKCITGIRYADIL